MFERPSGPLAQSYLPKCYKNTEREGRGAPAAHAQHAVADAAVHNNVVRELRVHLPREGRVVARAGVVLVDDGAGQRQYDLLQPSAHGLAQHERVHVPVLCDLHVPARDVTQM